MHKFDIVLWDVDDTLLDFHRSERYALNSTFQHFEIGMTDEMLQKYLEINQALWRQLEKGEVNSHEVLVGRFEKLFAYYHITRISAEEMQEFYKNALGSVFFYLDDSFEICEKLSKSYRQYVVTNGSVTTQTKKLHLSGLDDMMDDIFISEELGFHKPQKEFFDLCFQRIPNFSRERAIIIGDSLESDMKGGIAAGITTCWYNSNNKENTEHLKVDFEIKHLGDLFKILE